MQITPVRNAGLIALIAAFTAIAAVGAFASISSVSANGGGIEVDSAANVTADNSQPIIECKWELPDVDSELAGIQYGQDDDPNSGPDYPCDREADPGERPFMADNVQNVIQVLPNAEDLPEARKIENWVAVEHPNGVDEIDDVFWKVLHPDGSFKFQIHGIKVQVADSGDGELGTDGIVDLNDLGSTSMPGTMWYTAHQTEQITTSAVHTTDYGMIDLILQRQKDLYYQWWEISKDQMCGLYTIEATAVANGSTATMTNTLDIQCFFNLEIDFDSIDWGTITPGGTKVLPGDTSFGTSDYPTVKNTGNTGMRVGIEFSELVQDNVLGPKIIDTFDAAFGKNAQVLEWIDPIDAYETVWFSNDNLDQVLCNNEVGKLDLSVHPPSIVPSGSYSGYVTVLAELADAVCPNDFVPEPDPTPTPIPPTPTPSPTPTVVPPTPTPSPTPTPAEPFSVERKVTASDATLNDIFGGSVAINGDTAVVGARSNDDAGTNSGSVYILGRDVGGPGNWGEVKKLTASDADMFDEFGDQVSIDGDTVAVGTHGNDDTGVNSGSVYIFGRNTGGADNWGEVKKLAASDAAGGDSFGKHVSISGDVLVVGAPDSDDAGSSSGSAYILGRNVGGADNWGEIKKLTASDADAFDFFGATVSIDGDTAVIGAPGNDDAGSDSGSAYVFGKDVGGVDNWGEVKKLTASDAAADDQFGGKKDFSNGVSIDGDTIIVGALGNDDAGGESGSAYVFGRNVGGADNWGEVKKLTASDAAAGDEFGRSVSISGDTVIVGASVGDSVVADSGSAYIFGRNEGGADNWGEVKELPPFDGAANDRYGANVAIDGTTAIVGSRSDDDGASSAGSAYIYD